MDYSVAVNGRGARRSPHSELQQHETELRAALAEAMAERDREQKTFSESFSLLFGSGSGSLDLVGEDPRHDDGQVWDEVGLRGGGRHTRGRRRLALKRDLDRAREIARALQEENEFVIGASANRVSYIVGEGVNWRAVPRDRAAEDPAMTRAAGDLIEAWEDREMGDILDQELVSRMDRDGEALVRLYGNADGLLRARFLDPDLLVTPLESSSIETTQQRRARHFGVDVAPHDVRDVRGYFTREGMEASQGVQYVPAWLPMGIPGVIHAKANVDMAEPRGWPTFWPLRRNMARSEALLRASSYVATLQSSIALIRKYDRASKDQVQNFLQNHRDLLSTNNATGKQTSFRGIGPGTVIESGPGVSYESPISSVNAANNITILGAELRAGAAMLSMPEYMFSADASRGSYASTLVADGPPSKNFKRMQSRVRHQLRAIRQAYFAHEAFWGRLDPAILDRYTIVGDFPSTTVRDHLQETQRNQIMFSSGVLSRTTWRAREGLDPEEEDRHLDRETERGMSDARIKASEPTEKPPAGTGDGGPGGADMRGDPDNPMQAPGGDKF